MVALKTVVNHRPFNFNRLSRNESPPVLFLNHSNQPLGLTEVMNGEKFRIILAQPRMLNISDKREKPLTNTLTSSMVIDVQSLCTRETCHYGDITELAFTSIHAH